MVVDVAVAGHSFDHVYGHDQGHGHGITPGITSQIHVQKILAAREEARRW